MNIIIGTMNLENKYIDELITLREEARDKRNWKLSDKIRDYLDTKHIFIFDTNNGQEIYHRTKGSRQELIDQLKRDAQAEKSFEAWLFSMSINKSQNLAIHNN